MDVANLRLTNGVSSGLEALAWALTDEEEVVLVPTPTYSRSGQAPTDTWPSQVLC